jgi:hypothetical protein
MMAMVPNTSGIEMATGSANNSATARSSARTTNVTNSAMTDATLRSGGYDRRVRRAPSGGPVAE